MPNKRPNEHDEHRDDKPIKKSRAANNAADPAASDAANNEPGANNKTASDKPAARSKRRTPPPITETIEDTVDAVLCHYSLCSKPITIIIGVSGGPDSMALMHILANVVKTCEVKKEVKVVVAHLNHHLRGAASDKDEQLVRTAASKLNIPVEVEHADIEKLRRTRKLSLEEAGRQARHAFFFRLKEQYGADAIALGHHRDDNVETMIFNTIRGASLRGMSGISMSARGIIRPLLDFSKDELLAYCKENNITYHTDKTNADTSITRNYIRHHLIPSIEKINPSFRERFHEKSFYFTELEEFMAGVADDLINTAGSRENDEIIIPVAILHETPIVLQRHMIQRIYEQFHGSTEELSGAQIDDCLHLISRGKTGTEKTFGKRLTIGINYDNVHFQKEKSQEVAMLTEHGHYLPTPGTFTYGKIRITARVHATLSEASATPKDAVYVSQRNPDMQLFVRSVKPGDRITLFGREGRKKISDIFIDKKIPRAHRKNIPIIVDQTDKVVAIGSLQIDSLYHPSLFDKPVIEIEITGLKLS